MLNKMNESRMHKTFLLNVIENCFNLSEYEPDLEIDFFDKPSTGFWLNFFGILYFFYTKPFKNCIFKENSKLN